MIKFVISEVPAVTINFCFHVMEKILEWMGSDGCRCSHYQHWQLNRTNKYISVMEPNKKQTVSLQFLNLSTFLCILLASRRLCPKLFILASKTKTGSKVVKTQTVQKGLKTTIPSTRFMDFL